MELFFFLRTNLKQNRKLWFDITVYGITVIVPRQMIRKTPEKVSDITSFLERPKICLKWPTQIGQTGENMFRALYTTVRMSSNILRLDILFIQPKKSYINMKIISLWKRVIEDKTWSSSEKRDDILGFKTDIHRSDRKERRMPVREWPIKTIICSSRWILGCFLGYKNVIRRIYPRNSERKEAMRYYSRDVAIKSRQMREILQAYVGKQQQCFSEIRKDIRAEKWQ